MDQLRFSIPEILSLIGVAQTLYIIVYMLFRAGRLSRTGLPLLYFIILYCAFAVDFAAHPLGKEFEYYDIIRNVLWLSIPPVSVLVVIQVAQITSMPSLRYYAVLLLPVLGFFGALFITKNSDECSQVFTCDEFTVWLTLFGQISGAVSLLSIWAAHKVWSPLYAQKTGRERYWLILAMICLNTGFLISLFAVYTPEIDESMMALVRTVLGLGFVYLVTTSLFRIYPPSVRMMPVSESDETLLSDRELEMALRIEGLMSYEKIYHEPGYTRSDLARELGVPETTLSKIINLHFKKSFPQMLNEHRVEDAKRLLVETDAEVNVIAQESGFNSVASFNRVFKEITGEAPSRYRALKKR
ncbi:MAG: helix-turn-helix domain-containing protein [Alphaproteobacteria bacterium]|nr:helix-turn-helix domain-containing protein [Alphaproteobacteria bacterium]